jgi:hypothetical protein
MEKFGKYLAQKDSSTSTNANAYDFERNGIFTGKKLKILHFYFYSFLYFILHFYNYFYFYLRILPENKKRRGKCNKTQLHFY